jgi:phosphatidylglycerol---prolipoprotein diacylglyceryl transferase
MFTIAFPAIDPVAVEIGPLVIRWYALAYIVGFVGGWRYCMWLARSTPGRPTAQDFDDFLPWAVIGVILGGRFGYVVFYNLPHYLQNPLEALMVWQGGMAFHGGLMGVVVAILLHARRNGFSPFAMGDLIACAAPIGLFFGRIANFVNGELYGRPTDVSWAVEFPRGGFLPRHPSQLYEAALEGLVLFAVLFVLARMPAVRGRPGMLGGIFLAGYGLSRFVVEFYREPDPQLGFLFAGATMGQMLSVPMIAVGVAMALWAYRGGSGRASGNRAG